MVMEKIHKRSLREGGKAAADAEKNIKKALVKKDPIDHSKIGKSGGRRPGDKK
jgi:hypothetical protein